MKVLTRENIDEFMSFYHDFHDSYINDIKYDYKSSEVELLIDVFWSGKPSLKEDGTYNTNKTKIKMICTNVYQYKYKERFPDYIEGAYLKYIKIEGIDYICFATDNKDPLVSIVCEEIKYEEMIEDNKRENEILNMHNEMMNVYNLALEVYKVMDKKFSLGYYNNHLIKLRGEYIKQDYYMPVISYEDKGDICFNFDEVSYEVYLTKEEIKDYLDDLISKYKDSLSIYTTTNCDIDLYAIGDSKEDVLKRLDDLSDEEIGITIIESSRVNKVIVNNFKELLELLKRN